jgi:hypothetical protein
MARKSLRNFLPWKKEKANSPASTTASPRSQSRLEDSNAVKPHDPTRPFIVTAGQAPSTAPATPPQVINENDHPTHQAQLWIGAYNAISEEDPKLVAAYTAILSSKLRPESTSNRGEVDDDSNTGDALQQMNRAVKEGLRRTEKAAAVMDKMHEGMRIVSSVKALISSAAKHSPEAATAWAGICLLFEVRVSPSKRSVV